MAELNQHQYYIKSILKLMSAIEEASQQLFQDIDSDLEARFWKAHDRQDLTALKSIHYKLTNMLDDLNMD